MVVATAMPRILPQHQGKAMSSAEVPKFISPAEYLAAEELAETKSEYIDGWVRAMTGASVRHNQVKMNCAIALGAKLKGQKCRPFDSDMRLRIGGSAQTKFYYPDLQVICDSNAPTDVFQDSPVLIIEVLSPSTRRYDFDEKMNAYLQIPALQCYILLEQHQPIATIMRRTEGGFLRQQREGIEETIDLPFLGCELALRDIYDGIEFTPTSVRELMSEYELIPENEFG
jgi:Uma2 family endonuclease